MADVDRILVTGAGGFAGVNFVRALRASKRGYYIVGTDFNRYHLEFPDVDARYLTPRHDDPSFVGRIRELVMRETIDFLHPQPSSEALVLALNRRRLPCTIFLPSSRVMKTAQDKLLSQQILLKRRIPVARTKHVQKASDIQSAFREIGHPLWVRARHGAGGRLSLLCADAEEASHWIHLWARKGIALGEFVLQEYLPGRNIAWDSLWRHGRLVTSYARERLEYPLKHISPSGITGTPSVARIVHDEWVNRLARLAVKALDSEPSGAYSVDIKESNEGQPHITEVDAGKFHSTMPLWGYVGVKELALPWYANLADLYVRLGLGRVKIPSMPRENLYPQAYYLLRNIDVGAYLWKEDGWKRKVL
jgi:carbamoyl-phosphate synthase large subunit